MSEFSRRNADREEKREKFKQEGIRAWNAYRETGLRATQAESWLAELTK